MKLSKLFKKQKHLKKSKAFTLVELIVVITILAILSTIAFIALQGYTQNSRDSKRIADIGSIQKSLEIYITEKGRYPIPDEFANITYSGGIAWIEGIVGDKVIKNLDKINKKPLDPLTGNEYTYSVTAFKTEYQIGAINEGGNLGYKLPVNQIYAANTKKAKAMIRGNYNERFLKVQSGGINWILAIPSIIATDISQTELITILSSKKIVYNNYANIPHSYNNFGYTMNEGFDYTNPNPLIYSGSTTTLANDNEEKIAFVDNLKEAYKGTILQGEPQYVEIVNLDTEINQTKAVNLVNNYINTKVGGIGVTGMQSIPMSDIICGLNYRIENGVCVENIAEGQICTGLPANAVWNSTDNITQRWNGTAWIPSTTSTYNATASTTECRFKCDTNYTWNSTTGTCNADTKSAQACTGKPTNSVYNTATSITQTWNGTARSPSTVSTYNTTVSTTECRYKCNSGYAYQSGQCNFISPTCAAGYTYNTVRDKCEVAPTCTSGYTYNTSTKLCQKVETISASSTRNQCSAKNLNGTYLKSCSSSASSYCMIDTITQFSGFHYDAQIMFTSTCNIRGIIIYRDSDTTQAYGIDYDCRSTGLNVSPGGTGTCYYNFQNTSTISSSCPAGYTLSGTTCTRTLTATPTCSSGGALNTTINLCQVSSTCSVGSLDTSTDSCVTN